MHKEALERARKILCNINEYSDSCRDIETIFPELAESEDERIRKELLCHIQGEIDTYNNMVSGDYDSRDKEDKKVHSMLERAKAYLEKQKESLHISETCKENTDSFTDEDEDRTINGCLLAANAERRCKRVSEEFLEELGLADYTKFFYEQGVEKGKKEREKQKEQKPADEQFPPLEGLDAIKAKYYDDGFKNGFDEGVESVKPAEWDDYTKTNLDRALQIIRDAKGTLQGYQSDDGIYECDEAIECIEHFLYRGLGIEKPVEWSEDYREEDIQTRFAFYTYKDELGVLYLSNVFVEETSRNHGFGTRILKAAEKVAEVIGATTICLKVKQDSPANAWYRKHGYGYVAFEGDYDWLEKTLEYLKPKKPAEWSEEDEDTYNRVYYLFRDAIDEWYKAIFSGCYPKITRDKVLAMLRALKPKPRWKPSEEQMEALRRMKAAIAGEGEIYKPLNSLYEQLKKLM